MGEVRLSALRVENPRAIVLLLHGGQANSRQSVGPVNLAWWRMRLMRRRLRGRLRRRGIDVVTLRYRVRGWNGDGAGEPDPVVDARWALDELKRARPRCPVALVGHSMGGRTAASIADDPRVWLVVGLAPWWPAELAVEPLAGRDVVAAHGHRDRMTDLEQTRAFLRRARPVTRSDTFIDMGDVGHYMLRHGGEWADVVVEAVSRSSEAKARASAA